MFKQLLNIFKKQEPETTDHFYIDCILCGNKVKIKNKILSDYNLDDFNKCKNCKYEAIYFYRANKITKEPIFFYLSFNLDNYFVEINQFQTKIFYLSSLLSSAASKQRLIFELPFTIYDALNYKEKTIDKLKLMMTFD